MRPADGPAASRRGASLNRLFDGAILGRPGAVVALFLALFAYCGYHSKDFRLDASADSLVLEHDEDLRYFNKIADIYSTKDFLIVTYRPEEPLFSKASLDRLKAIREEIKALKWVDSVTTILDVPLLSNPQVPLKDLRRNIKTLEDPKADLKLAVKEFTESPLYSNLIVSPDLRSSAIQVNFRANKGQDEWLKRRAALREKRYVGELSPEERSELKGLEERYLRYKDIRGRERHAEILAIRDIVARRGSQALFHLAGMPMIVDDILSFIRHDLRVGGLGLLTFFVLCLLVIFRRVRWVFLPLFCCASSVVVMMGLLGLFGWEVTVVSSNFISLKIIFTMQYVIYMVVTYRGLLRERPQAANRELVLGTVRMMFIPILYSLLTEVAGFSSLVVCDILPVVNFGWMNILGLCISMTITFLFFPPALLLMPKPPAEKEKEFGLKLTSIFGDLAEKHRPAIFACSVLVAAVTVVGCFRLEVENSFVNYFKRSTEIYQGMQYVDENLGGTTPLDIVLDFKPSEAPRAKAAGPKDEFSDFEEAREEGAGKYWFTSGKLELINKVHDYAQGLESSGKVLSLGTFWKIVRSANRGKDPDDLTLALFFSQIPGKYREVIVDPYASVENNQARVTLRIKDSLKDLRRDALLKKMRSDLIAMGLKPDQFRLTGPMVLYNNMLQSLYRSQIQTIGYTLLTLTAMLLVLFRSLKLSLIGIAPNLLSASIILGVLGLAKIPLDMMTITIVAIAMGVAVDSAIQYLYRFRHEFKIDSSYVNTMRRCNASVGNAIYYSQITIVIGYSFLMLSKFIPTILFGFLSALAMAVSLVASLTLLPALVILFKPFGPEK